MGLAIPESEDIRQLVQSVNRLVQINEDRLEIEEFLAKLLGAKPRAYIGAVTQNGITLKGEITMAELREGQFIDLTAVLETKAGHPAKYEEGTESWETSGLEATVTKDATNPLIAKLVGVDGSTNASGVVTFRADGDPDADNVRDIVLTFDYVVTRGEAFVGHIDATPAADLPPTP